MSSNKPLDGVRLRHPEWAGWISVIEEVQREIANDAWEAMVPIPGDSEPAPLICGTAIALDLGVARRYLERLIRTASRCGTDPMASLAAIRPTNQQLTDVFCDALNQEDAWITRVAIASGGDAEALKAVAALSARPLLHACRRRWRSMRRSWVEGRCFVCGAWPAFAEVRGIERSRYFRCGRCASEWHARELRCPYCGNDDHREVERLVPDGATNAVIDGCRRCGGYVKTFTQLQACAPEAVTIEDLGTAHLDVAALEDGFLRPPAAPLSPAASVRAESGGSRGFRGWELGLGR